VRFQSQAFIRRTMEKLAREVHGRSALRGRVSDPV
jgi:hypothetical protein